MSRFKLPILSGLLFALALFPFYLWPFALCALYPLYRFSIVEKNRKTIFWGGCIAGAITTFPTLYFSLSQLSLIPDAPLFTYMIRLSSLLGLLVCAALFGGAMVLYATLRTKNILRNSFVGAACYGVVEIVLFRVFGGYYYCALSHALVPFPPALWLASIGGALFVSVTVAWLCSFAAEVSLVGLRERGAQVAAAVVLVVLAAMFATHYLSIKTPASAIQTKSIAIIQLGSAQLPTSFVEVDGDTISGSYLETLFHTAAMRASIVVYPFTPVEGAVYRGAHPKDAPGLTFVASDAQLGAWAESAVPATTTLVLWNSISEAGHIYDEYAVWHGGAEAEYRKRALYDLSDYAPGWLTALGLAKTPLVIEPGLPDNQAISGGVAFGGLICSELHQPWLARQEAMRSSFLLAIGSDSMFPNDISSEFSLAAARLRAAENGIAVVRGNVRGPSAIIAADGSIQNMLPYEQEGTVYGTVTEGQILRTPYSRWGNWFVFVLVGLALASAGFSRSSGIKSPSTQG